MSSRRVFTRGGCGVSLGERLEAREEGVEVQREAEVAAHFFLAHKLGAVGEGDRQGQLDACLAERYRQLAAGAELPAGDVAHGDDAVLPRDFRIVP